MPLPVRLEATLTLTKFLGNKTVEDMLRPLLGTLIEQHLNLMKEIDTSELTESL